MVRWRERVQMSKAEHRKLCSLDQQIVENFENNQTARSWTRAMPLLSVRLSERRKMSHLLPMFMSPRHVAFVRYLVTGEICEEVPRFFHFTPLFHKLNIPTKSFKHRLPNSAIPQETPRTSDATVNHTH